MLVNHGQPVCTPLSNFRQSQGAEIELPLGGLRRRDAAFGDLSTASLFNLMTTAILDPLPPDQNLSEARSRLDQRRFWRPRPHFSAFFEIHIFPLHHSGFL